MTEAMSEESLFELLSLECRVDGTGTLRYYDALGQLHRIHGPAFTSPGGHQRSWYQNGRRHRVDGPAVEWSDGYRAWFINGIELTEAEWRRAVASMEAV